MLVDCQYLTNSKRLVVSYVDNTGDIKLKYFEWEQPTKYVTCSDTDQEKHPIFKSWDGKSVKLEQVSIPDRYSIYEFLDALPDKEKQEIFDFNLPKIYFVDIETEIVDGFPDAETAPTQVLSISIVYDDKIILLGLREMPEEIEYLKIPEFLEGKNKITQEEMLQHIRQNLPKIEKKILKTDPLRREYDELDYEKEIMDNKITNSAEDIMDVVPDYTDEDVANFREKVKNVNSPEFQEEKKRIFDKVLKGKTFDEYKAKLAAKNSLKEASYELEGKLDNINSLTYKTKKQIFQKLYPNYMDMPKAERRLLKDQFDKKFEANYFDPSMDQGRIIGFRYFPPEFDEFLPENFKELAKQFNDTDKQIREISSQISRLEGELPRYLPSDIAKLEKLEETLNNSFKKIEDASLIKDPLLYCCVQNSLSNHLVHFRASSSFYNPYLVFRL